MRVVNEEWFGVSGVDQTPEVVGADSETPIAKERDLVQEDVYIYLYVFLTPTRWYLALLFRRKLTLR